MTPERAALPTLSTDLLLVHAPAVFEFRGRRDIYFPFLGTSGDVPITPLYEYFPVGFKTLRRHLGDRGHRTEIINLASLFLRYPQLALETVLDAVEARVIGIDLHWMVHVQGCLEIAERISRQRPDVPVLLGGISATYFADELIQMPAIDMVMRGYDTHEPMVGLLDALRSGRSLHDVPNLLWKSADGEVHDNGFAYLPDSFGCGIDWSTPPEQPKRNTLPIREVLSTQNAGCSYNCGWCGGSREAFRRIYGRKRAMARRPADEVAYEFDTLTRLPDVQNHHFYAVGSYNESRTSFGRFLDHVGQAGLRSISYEQFHLPPPEVLERMVAANPRTTITLSPESHDPHIARLAGRGVYTNDELERWLEQALDIGIFGVDIWYFVGMPQQDERSVRETVEYCGRLLRRFKGSKVNPMICPMIPFLDPASTFFEFPADHGYRVFHRTAEEHRRGMERASIINRINYETTEFDRRDLVHVGFTAVRDLMALKADIGFFPKGIVRSYNTRIEDALAFIDVVHEADCLPDADDRRRALEDLGDEILRRNDAVLFGGVDNQALPVHRQIGGRWFDEMGWSSEVLDASVGRSGTSGDHVGA